MNHDFLKPKELTNIKSILTARIADCEAFLNPNPMFASDTDNMMADVLDRAVLEGERQTDQHTRTRAEKKLAKLKGTLRVIDNEPGEYGFCNSCGVEIEYNRLESVPTAEYCIDCQGLKEIREKQNAH